MIHAAIAHTNAYHEELDDFKLLYELGISKAIRSSMLLPEVGHLLSFLVHYVDVLFHAALRN